MRIVLALAILATVVVAGCNSPAETNTIGVQSVSGGSGGTGGTVSASAPAVQSFAADRGSGDNGGSFVTVFSGTIFSPNGERHLTGLTVAGTGPTTLTTTHVITGSEQTATSEPSSFGSDGFKVWDGGAAKDGVLNFKFQQSFPVWTPAGTYSFAATTKDDSNLTSP